MKVANIYARPAAAKLLFLRRIKKNTLLLCLLLLPTLYACHSDARSNSVLDEEEQTLQEKKRAKQGRHIAKLATAIDSIVVRKSEREMTVYAGNEKLKTYIISLGQNPKGAKRSQGDNKTPEGIYYINDRNANSIYHKNLGVSYPNNKDRAYANQHNVKTGGDIKIHGLPNKQKYKTEDYLASDWTWGCIAVSNEEIDELFKYVKTGAVINILP